jgi:hypothetical protein
MNDEFYVREGIEYERVSRIINYFQPPELVEYRIKVGNKVANSAMRSAGRFGTMIDEAIRKDWRNPKATKVSVESKAAIDAWKTWAREHGVEEIEFPETFFSESLRVAGTPDFIWGNMIVDIKCSSRVSPVYFAQLGAYAYLSGKQIEDVAVLRLDKKTGMYEFVKASTLGLSVGDCINYFHALIVTFRNYKQVQCALKGNGDWYDVSEW